jgi:S1-C subfamily serine protease
MDVTSGGPADQAGIKGSSKQVQIDGSNALVGGDVIVSINGQPVNQFDDMVSYLFKNGVIGQSVQVGILRDAKLQTVNVVLAARPATAAVQPSQRANNQNTTPNPTVPRVALGIAGLDMDATLAQAMNLNQSQQGVLVEQVITGSPADKAGIKASDKPFTYQGQQVKVGGDIITAVKGSPITSVQELRRALVGAAVGDQIQLTVLRDGKEISVDVTLTGN